jgi:hypothetical protein
MGLAPSLAAPKSEIEANRRVSARPLPGDRLHNVPHRFVEARRKLMTSSCPVASAIRRSVRTVACDRLRSSRAMLP